MMILLDLATREKPPGDAEGAVTYSAEGAVTYSTDKASAHKYEAAGAREDGATGAVLAQSGVPAGSLYGFNPIPAGGATVTNELVNELREELGI